MKRFALCAALLLLISCGTTPQATEYRDLAAGFRLMIPAGWKALHGYGDVRLLLSPENEKSTATRISVHWDRRPDGEAVSLGEYAKFRVSRLSHFAQKRKLLDQQHRAMNKQLSEAIALDYQYEIGPGHAVRTRSWLLVSNKGQYTISLTAPPDQFETLQAQWQVFERGFGLES
ncbi:MAG: hypothetical protein ACSHXK_02930 [Oceanococcus sp.]